MQSHADRTKQVYNLFQEPLGFRIAEEKIPNSQTYRNLFYTNLQENQIVIFIVPTTLNSIYFIVFPIHIYANPSNLASLGCIFF